jgi:hypothetical protein
MTSMARREVEGRESKRGRAREGEGRGSYSNVLCGVAWAEARLSGDL